MSVFHFNLVDKLREVFIGKTHEELEKQKAFVRI
jgi:U2-associated protein SR140